MLLEDGKETLDHALSLTLAISDFLFYVGGGRQLGTNLKERTDFARSIVAYHGLGLD